ncbi:TrmH family RNA methyltransferase [Nonlabens xiamenensis]|uniref:TrmH family RNA methyltransferase n=1 Tax=Nonlabens xiamenensis TaxID=2341043 RepID=UPI000F60535C|nr:RNA methyltransferase [Nonlabens xiamenensis]
MITKATIKLIKSLSRKKNREAHGLFVVEGYKSIRELAQCHLIVKDIFCTPGQSELNDLKPEVITQKEMDSISFLKTAPGYLAVFEIPAETEIPQEGKILGLDDIKDPGNFGTIIRLADWFGIQHLVCSKETVDAYNPKCVQASMASLGRVHLHYTDLEVFCRQTKLALFPSTMEGQSLYEEPLPDDAMIIVGNESRGIRSSILEMGTALSIPQYGDKKDTESLNVAMATAILLGEWMRPIGR